MSEHFQTIVDVEATDAEAGSLAQRVCERLLAECIIAKDGSIQSIRSGDRALAGVYLPGPRAAETSARAFRGELDPEDAEFQPQVGRCMFFHGEDGSDSEAHCPDCAGACDVVEALDAAFAWQKAESDTTVLCPMCGKRHEVLGLHFEPAWGFGFLAFTFKFWSPFEHEFVDQVAAWLGHRVVLVEWFI